MANLDTLMNIAGVEGAFRFSPKGELQEQRIASGSKLNDTVLDLLCHVCVANMAIATMQARGWEKVTGMQGFYPVNGFSLVGFEWTAVVNDEYGVVVPNNKVDYDRIYSVLNG
jgi:roadblock/LC7 domain-containing protein